MPLVTYTGPAPGYSVAGIRLTRGEPLPLPPDMAARLAAYPFFEVEAQDAPEPPPARKRGRPRKG